MATWGVKSFENDISIDFIEKIFDKGKFLIKKKIQEVINFPATKILNTQICEEALCAIEFIAAAKDNASTDFPVEAKEWMYSYDLFDYRTPFNKYFIKHYDIINDSIQAIDRILTSSELKTLWMDTSEYKNWLNVMEDLKQRLLKKIN